MRWESPNPQGGSGKTPTQKRNESRGFDVCICSLFFRYENSVKKSYWLYIYIIIYNYIYMRYVFHHFIEEIGRGMFKNPIVICFFLVGCLCIGARIQCWQGVQEFQALIRRQTCKNPVAGYSSTHLRQVRLSLIPY